MNDGSLGEMHRKEDETTRSHPIRPITFDVNIFLGRSFEEVQTQLIGELLASICRNHPLFLHIAFVAYKDHLDKTKYTT